VTASETAAPAEVLGHKTTTGQYWHLEQKPGEFLGTMPPADLLTACGRTLGRLDMVEAQPLAEIATYDVCEGCRRKAAESASWLPAAESPELARLQRSIADRIEAGAEGIQCAGASMWDGDGWFPGTAVKKPYPARRQPAALRRAAQRCGSREQGLCPIARDCALAAMARGEESGVWGGIPAWALRDARSKGPEALDELLRGASTALANTTRPPLATCH
jgi:hypothetical protein